MTKELEGVPLKRMGKENIIEEGGVLIPNDPNAKILITALQHMGYDDLSAIADIIDNSIDADATKIKIYIEKDENDKTQIIIADNGNGMDRETLMQALVLGSETEHNDISDLGKFGMGLSTAGLALANKTIVLTKKDENVWKSMTDVEIVKRENQFFKTLNIANEKEKNYFKEIVQNDTGTIVILKDCVGIKLSEESTLKAKVIKHIARVFRNFMSKTEFYVNEIKIEADDPLRLNVKEEDLEATLFSEDDYEVKWKNASGEEQNGVLHVKLSALPECNASIARKLGINQQNQGFSILRNNREIAFGYLPKWEGLTRDPHLNRFRGEISFSSDMDEAMGVNFIKRDIDMKESISNVLRIALMPQIKTIRSRTKKKKEVTEEERKNHELTEKVLNKNSKILNLPMPNSKGDGNKKSKIAEFKLINMGETGDIYKVEQIGKDIIISWNIDHPFYQKLLLENFADENVIVPVNLLIYTLASAQIQYIAQDDERMAIMSNIISTMSTNLRILLSN